MEHGPELWSPISPPLHHIFYDQNLIIVALIPTQWWRAYAHWTWGWTPTFVSCYCVLSFLQQVTVVRTKGMMEKLGQCLSQLQTSVNQIKPSLSVKRQKQMWISQGHPFRLFWTTIISSSSSQTSEASVAVLGSPGSCRAFTASMMQCWTTAAHGGDETHSDSRFTPGVHYHKLAVKFFICLQLRRSSTHWHHGFGRQLFLWHGLTPNFYQSHNTVLLRPCFRFKGQVWKSRCIQLLK